MKFFSAIDTASPGESLAAALYGFEVARGIRLTVHDCHGVLYDPDGRSFLPGRLMHSHLYCRTGRFEREGWNRRCHEECQLRVEGIARSAGRPFVHRCWKGVSELVVPLERDGSLALLLFAGVFRPPDAGEPEGVPGELLALRRTLPEEDERHLAALAVELQVLGHGILHYLDQYRGRGGTPGARHDAIRRYIEDHAHEAVTLRDLARAMNLSPTRTCHLVKYHFGRSFHVLLTRERMIRARNLLCSSELPVKAVAAAVGFDNEFYFNRVFSREFGLPPGEFRRRSRASVPEPAARRVTDPAPGP